LSRMFTLGVSQAGNRRSRATLALRPSGPCISPRSGQSSRSVRWQGHAREEPSP
jgi:hypothetical protein